MNKIILLALSATLWLSCSRNRNTTPTDPFYQKTAHHQVVAILPMKVELTGNLPKDMTPEMKVQQEQQDSKMYSDYLLSQITFRSDAYYQYRVSFQPYSTTLQYLEANGISVEDSYTKDPIELARILGVDAVVRSSMQKNRLMSDAASMGVQAAGQVAGVLLNGALNKPGTGGQVIRSLPNVGNSANPALRAKTHRIMGQCQLIDGKTGFMLWNSMATREADWQFPEVNASYSVCTGLSYNFPYLMRVPRQSRSRR